MQRILGGGGGIPGTMPPQTDAPVYGGQPTPPGSMMSPNSIRNNSAFQSQFQIQQLEQQLMDAQRKYAQMQATTQNPQQLAAMQSGMQQLAQQLAQVKQNARNQFSMDAMRMQQRSQMPGAGSMGVGPGSGGQPNQGYANQAQLMQMMAALFGGGGGAGADRMW